MNPNWTAKANNTANRCINMKILLPLLLLGLLHLTPVTAAGTPEYDKAHLAVSNILFDYEQPGYEFASFRVNDDGFVDILFAENMPDDLYGEILTKMQNHPDIDGVLSSKGGPACKLW